MYYLHFTDEEIKTRRSSMTCLRSQNQQVAVGSDVGLFGSETWEDPRFVKLPTSEDASFTLSHTVKF